MTPDRTFADALYAALSDCGAIEFAPVPKPKPAPAPQRMRVSGPYIRIIRTGADRHITKLYLSGALLAMLRWPRRCDLWHDGCLTLAPCSTGRGWAVCLKPNQKGSGAWMVCNAAAPMLADYDGAYRVVVEGRRAIVGEKVG